MIIINHAEIFFLLSSKEASQFRTNDVRRRNGNIFAKLLTRWGNIDIKYRVLLEVHHTANEAWWCFGLENSLGNKHFVDVLLKMLRNTCLNFNLILPIYLR